MIIRMEIILKMPNPFKTLLLLTHQILLVHAAHMLHQDRGSVFNKYMRTKMTGITGYKSTVDHDKEIECLLICREDRPRCRSFNVRSDTGPLPKFHCDYFTENTAGGEVKKTIYYRYWTLDAPATCSSSGYCKELADLNLCGKCKCVDKCSSMFSHYCSCTNLPVIKSCNEATMAGLYRLQFSSSVKKVFCEGKKSSEPKRLTWMRRYTASSNDIFSKQSLDSYNKGFGSVHSVSYWLGLNHVAEYTHASHTVLRVEVVNIDGRVLVGEYEGFRITKFSDSSDSTRYRYEFKKYTTCCCLLNMFHVNVKHFALCKDKHKEYWFDGCKADRPTAAKIYICGVAYNRISLLLEHRDDTCPSMLTCQVGDFKNGNVVTTLSDIKTLFDCKKACCEASLECASIGYTSVTKICRFYSDTAGEGEIIPISVGDDVTEYCSDVTLRGISIQKGKHIGAIQPRLGREICLKFEFYIKQKQEHRELLFLHTTNGNVYIRVYEDKGGIKVTRRWNEYWTTPRTMGFKINQWTPVVIEYRSGTFYISVDGSAPQIHILGTSFEAWDQTLYTSLNHPSNGIIRNLFVNGKQYFLPETQSK